MISATPKPVNEVQKTTSVLSVLSSPLILHDNHGKTTVIVAIPTNVMITIITPKILFLMTFLLAAFVLTAVFDCQPTNELIKRTIFVLNTKRDLAQK